MKKCRRSFAYKVHTRIYIGLLNSDAKVTKFLSKKSSKNYPTISLNHIHIYRPWQGSLQSFKMIRNKRQEELRTQGSFSVF